MGTMQRLIPIFWGAAFVIASMPMWRPCPPCAGTICVAPAQETGDAATPVPAKPAPPKIPESRGGADMLGRPLPLDGLRWVASPVDRAAAKPAPDAGRVTLLRWWTDGCPHCRRSLPALETLRRDFAERGLDVIAVYHAKPPRDVSDEQVRDWAGELGFNGRLAVDADWGVLRERYLSKGRRSATSASFLLDGRGDVRFVHPGPAFAPSDDPAEARLDQDYDDLRSAIESLLQSTQRDPGK